MEKSRISGGSYIPPGPPRNPPKSNKMEENLSILTNEELLEKYLVREKYLGKDGLFDTAGLKKEILSRMTRGHVEKFTPVKNQIHEDGASFEIWLDQLESAGKLWEPIEYFDENFPLMPEYWIEYYDAGYSPAAAIREDSQIYGGK